MVNIAKRMRILKPLLSLRHGPGAAILPQYLPVSEPSIPIRPGSNVQQQQQQQRQQQQALPTLLRVRLTFPPGIGPASKGARAFWRNHLRRLKYHNPALPIIVDQNAQQGTPGHKGPAWRLALDFEGGEKALRELATEPKNEHFKALMEDELRPQPRAESESSAGDTGKLEPQSKKKPTRPASSSSSSSSSSPSPSPNPSPTESDPTSSSSTDQCHLVSTRTVSLPVLNRPAGALWFWFQQRTKCIDVPETESDRQLAAELAEHTVRSEEDRRRVKKEIDAMKAKEQMLKLARREVDRMKEDQ